MHGRNYQLHFTDRETEAKTRDVTYPRPGGVCGIPARTPVLLALDLPFVQMAHKALYEFGVPTAEMQLPLGKERLV